MTYIKEHEKFDMYKDIFKLENQSTNIFFNIVDKMQSWFFNLSKYASVTTQEYIGKGKYKKVPKDITKFKDYLRGIQNNPFYYESEKILEIFENNEIYQLKQSKCFIDNTLNRLKKTLQNYIDYIFPETIDTWHRNLSTDIKNRIFADGEEKFLLLCKNKNNNNYFIESIAKYLTGISLENWNDNTPTYFYNRLMQIRNIIENNENKKIDNGFIINYISWTDKFSKILEILQNTNKDIEKVMLNDLTALFNDYGQQHVPQRKSSART